MKPIPTLVILVAFAGTAVLSYQKGRADMSAKRDAQAQAEYENDSNSDPSALTHSISFHRGYSRGHADGTAETIATQTTKCEEELANLVVETGNAKVAGKYLVEGYFAPSQLQAVIDRPRKKEDAEGLR
jgi:hypothetical protein